MRRYILSQTQQEEVRQKLDDSDKDESDNLGQWGDKKPVFRFLKTKGKKHIFLNTLFCTLVDKHRSWHCTYAILHYIWLDDYLYYYLDLYVARILFEGDAGNPTQSPIRATHVLSHYSTPLAQACWHIFTVGRWPDMDSAWSLESHKHGFELQLWPDLELATYLMFRGTLRL